MEGQADIQNDLSLEQIVEEINAQHEKGNFTFKISIFRIHNLITEKAVNQHRQLALNCVNEMGGQDVLAFRAIVERRMGAVEQQ